MKIKLLISSLFVLFFLAFTLESHAQVDDTLPPWFKNPTMADILTPQGKIIQGPFSLSALSKKSVVQISSGKAKSLQLPASVRVLPAGTTVKKGNTCFQIGCDKKGGCTNCELYWWDRNGDRKIQPRQELRCICPDASKPCKIKGRRTDC